MFLTTVHITCAALGKCQRSPEEHMFCITYVFRSDISEVHSYLTMLFSYGKVDDIWRILTRGFATFLLNKIHSRLFFSPLVTGSCVVHAVVSLCSGQQFQATRVGVRRSNCQKDFFGIVPREGRETVSRVWLCAGKIPTHRFTKFRAQSATLSQMR